MRAEVNGDRLPGGIAAPRCLGVVEHADDEPWMWLEDVTGEPALRWPLERFEVAAYHLGLMHGWFLAGGPLPDSDWLDTGRWLRQSLGRGARQIHPILERFERHPLTERFSGSETGQALRRLWAERELFFEAMDRMPRTLCHGDFNYTNLFARRLPSGEDQTVAVDWQYCGLRQLGADISGFIADSSIIPVRRKAAEPEEFTALALGGYLSGLRDGGGEGDVKTARFACLARLALPWSFNLLRGLDAAVLSQQVCRQNRPQLEEKLDEYIRRQAFLLELADEARALLRAIGP